MRSLSNQIEFLKQTNLYCDTTKGKNIESKILDAYLGYKKSLTGYGFNNAGFLYDRINFVRHETSYKLIIQNIFKAIIEVNKL